MTPSEKQQIIFVYLVNKMLKKHGVDFDFISEFPKIEDKDWNKFYTWSTKERTAFFNEAVDYVRQTMRIYSKKQCAQIVVRFLTRFGLRTI